MYKHVTCYIKCTVRLCIVITCSRPPSHCLSSCVEAAINASSVVSDMTAPILQAFHSDLDSGQLTLTFSETILARSVNTTAFSLQSTSPANNDTLAYTLTGGEVLTPDGPLVTIELSADDLDEIKLISGLAAGVTSTYLMLTELAVTDAEGNQVEPLTRSNPANVTSFTEDTTPPELRSFVLDLDNGQLNLNFTEAVLTTNFEFNGFMLSSGIVLNESTVITLDGGNITGIDRSVISVTLTSSNVNTIKQFSNGIGLEVNSTLLSIAAESLFDTSANPLNGTAFLPAENIIVDSVPPELLSFALDMNTGELTLNFSETVFAVDVIPSELGLLSTTMLNSSTSCYNITGGSVMQVNNTSVVIELTTGDLNEIKRRPLLAIDQNSTNLAVLATAVRDTTGNTIVPISFYDALRASSYVMDMTKPQLASFDLDLNTGELVLKFTETVNATSLDIQKYSFLDALRSNATANYTLTGN